MCVCVCMCALEEKHVIVLFFKKVLLCVLHLFVYDCVFIFCFFFVFFVFFFVCLFWFACDYARVLRNSDLSLF